MEVYKMNVEIIVKEMNKKIEVEVNKLYIFRKFEKVLCEKRNKWYKIFLLVVFFIIWEMVSRINVY